MKTKIKTLLIVLLVSLSANTIAQTMKVSGKITDVKGEELIGVSISIKGTNKGTVSDIDGNYSLNVNKNNTLIFALIGFKSKEITVTKSEIINVTLEENNQQLNEIVITGCPQRQSSLTGYVSTISPISNQILTTPVIQEDKKVYETKDLSSQSYYMIASPSINQPTRERYGSYVENKFTSPLQEALSTFSIDTDGASYSNFRHFTNQGQKTPMDAVRIEEFINYFKYNYDEPTQENPIKITTEVSECPWDKQNKLFRIGLKAKEIDKDKLPASNLVFLIDVSGSMSGATRLDLVKSSMNLLVNNLRDNDRVAIVVYANEVGEKLESTPGSDKQKIKDVINSLYASGGTNGGRGLEIAYDIARKNFIKDGNNRIILCTDGDFNIGPSSNKELEELIEKERKSGVFLSILGYGMGNYQDEKMQILAQKGNGNASYIDNLQEANKVLVQEFGGTLFTIAKDVKLQIEFNPAQVQAYRLLGYESRLLNKEDFNDDTKDAGEMGVGHTVTALYEIVPVGIKSNVLADVDDLKYQKTKKNNKIDLKDSPELLTVKLRYKKPDGDKSVKMEIPVIDNKKNAVSSDMKFASAVAMFAQLMKDSDYKGSATYNDVIDLAKKGFGEDENGYRREFVRLVETVKEMD